MTDKTSQEFTPITSQEEFDDRIKARLARERERWEKESGTGDLRAQLEAKNEAIANIKREHHLENARRAVRDRLAQAGHTNEGKNERIMRHLDLDAIEADEDGNLNPRSVTTAIAAVEKDLPELFDAGKPVRDGTGSGGSGKPVFTPEKPLTREVLEGMSAEEINQPGTWERVQKFLAGERG